MHGLLLPIFRYTSAHKRADKVIDAGMEYLSSVGGIKVAVKEILIVTEKNAAKISVAVCFL